VQLIAEKEILIVVTSLFSLLCN